MPTAYLSAVNFHDQSPSSATTFAKVIAIHVAVDRKLLIAKLERVCLVFGWT